MQPSEVMNSDWLWLYRHAPHCTCLCSCVFSVSSLKADSYSLRISHLISTVCYTPEVMIQILRLVGLFSQLKRSTDQRAHQPSIPCSMLESQQLYLTCNINNLIYFPAPSLSRQTTHTDTHSQTVLLTLFLLSMPAGNVSHALFDKNNFLHHWSHRTCFSFLFFFFLFFCCSSRKIVIQEVPALELRSKC